MNTNIYLSEDSLLLKTLFKKKPHYVSKIGTSIISVIKTITSNEMLSILYKLGFFKKYISLIWKIKYIIQGINLLKNR